MENRLPKNTVLIVTVLSSFLTPFMGASINVALPTIGNEFKMDAVLLSWVATSFLLSASIFLVPFGKVADTYGRKRVFLYGMVIYTLSSLLCVFANSSETLILFRIMQGIGSSMIFGTAIAILTSVFPPQERGKALGINVSAVYMGLSLGPFLGGLLTQKWGWRSVFIINVPLCAIIIIAMLWKLKGEWMSGRKGNFDFIGSTIYAIMLSSLMYGLSSLPKPTGIYLTLLGFLGIFAFIKWEMRTENPVFDINLFRKNVVFALSNLSALINYSATSAVGFLLSLYLQYIKGFEPKKAGIILVAQPIVMAIFSPFAGRLSDKIEPRIVASVGMAFTTLGLLLLTSLNNDTTIIFIIVNLIVLGFGFALFSSPNTNAIMGSVEKQFYGVASGTVGTMRLTGQMLSMGIAMLIFAICIGRVKITPEYYPLFINSLKIAFSIFAILCFGGIFASLARGKVRQE